MIKEKIQKHKFKVIFLSMLDESNNKVEVRTRYINGLEFNVYVFDKNIIDKLNRYL